MTSCETIKIVLVGDGGTGKSSYVDRLNSGGFRKDYIATLGAEVHHILVSTTHGEYKLIISDTSGQEKVGPLRDNYYEGANGAIIFFDVTSRITYKNVPQWHKDILRICPDIPCVLCANKIDVSLRKVKSKSITYAEKCKIGFFEISVKDSKGLKQPVEYLLQRHKRDPSLKVLSSLGSDLFEDVDKLTLETDK